MKTMNKELEYCVKDANDVVVYQGKVIVALEKEQVWTIEGCAGRKDDVSIDMLELISNDLFPFVEEDYKKVNSEYSRTGDLEIEYDITKIVEKKETNKRIETYKNRLRKIEMAEEGADVAEIEMTYSPAISVQRRPEVHVKVTRNLGSKRMRYDLFVDDKQYEIEMPDDVRGAINKRNMSALLSNGEPTGKQLDGGRVDYMFRLNDSTIREEGVGDGCLPDNRLMKLLMRWCKDISDEAPLNDLLNAMTVLDVERVEEQLGMYGFGIGMNDSVITIPIAWEWLIGDKDSWRDKEEGNDFYERNQEIKELLSKYLGIDWDNVPEDCLPDAIVRSCMDSEKYDRIEDFFDFDIEYMREHYDEKDILLYYYVHRMEIDKVAQLVAQDADPHSIIDGGDDAEMYAIVHSEGGLNSMVHVVYGEYDLSMTYATSIDDVYATCYWTLVSGAAYARLIRLLE